MKTLTVALIGAGQRGDIYTTQMCECPEQLKVIAVAEPIAGRREKVQKRHGIADDMCFETGEELLQRPKLADIALICTQDNQHYHMAMQAIAQGYDILLEKPVAPTAQECVDIALAAKEKGVKVLVCHVLRYTTFFNRVKQLILDGTVGEVQSVVHVEAVGNVHQSHCFVRGNWHSEQDSSMMLLAK
ncbi:MAG: Gfo/Idh/MocA family oxidoreductase, partial [Clostridia bacterium]|nr:Gfo/Idh/MocA family oxidoreductase [Clostridia bacterium]